MTTEDQPQDPAPQIDGVKLRRANVGNIIKKLKAGKTLSAVEIKAIERAEAPEPKRADDVVENMRAAASRCGCSSEEVKLAKALGCDAFAPNNRISISKLTAFIDSPLFQSQAAEKVGIGGDWKKRLLKAKAQREELRLNQERGDVWDSETVRRAYTAGDEAMMATLRRWLESDLPPLIEGKSAGEILAVNVKFLDELTGQLRADRDAAVVQIAEESGQRKDEGEEDEAEASA
jgi:hypothetical protein